MATSEQFPNVILPPTLPPDSRHPLHWCGLHGASPALPIAAAVNKYRGLVLLIVPDSPSATQWENALRTFCAQDTDILVFPDSETLPYDVFSPQQDITSHRLGTLARLPHQRRGIVIVPVATLAQRLPPKDYLNRRAFSLQKGDILDWDSFRQRLDTAGYSCVSQVVGHGEFTIKGTLFDIFPMGSAHPYRVERFDDMVESIRTFHPETQLSITEIHGFTILPAREVPLDQAAIAFFRDAHVQAFGNDPQHSMVYREVSAGHAIGGIEAYLPLFFPQTATLFDYLPEATLVIRMAGAQTALGTFYAQVMDRYEQRCHDRERPLLPPPLLFLEAGEIDRALLPYLRVEIAPPDQEEGTPFPTTPPPRFEAIAEVAAWLSSFQGRVLFIAETAGRREVLINTLQQYSIKPRLCDNWADFLSQQVPLGLIVAPVEHGLCVTEPPIVVMTEYQLYGERVRHARRRHATLRNPEAVIRDLTNLRVGAPIVHMEHGIGRYAGLERLCTAGMEDEFLTITYANEARLYVPVAALHQVSRYTGANPDHAPLHTLGSGQWEKAKRKATEKANDVAAELLGVYARRQARQGHAFVLQKEDYNAFTAAFPFEETPDQQTAIEAVVADMASPQPMDRIICGDVGFGKTEVAMRAAFIAVLDGHQVAVLAPTTLLAQQHYQNFLDRFADWPIKIGSLSRFCTAKEQTETLFALAEGRIDILIGTHKLLQPSVVFKSLGLLIIDEEHRFGVRDKERLKALRADVDILTMTATPIPRTLNMAMAGLRGLSIIATPPEGRLAVKTFIGEWNTALIQEAFQRELKRGGQVYFVHNEVETIQRKAAQVAEWAPHAKVGIAHGKMREKELERVMLDFYHRRCHILVCTTIVESGIDVPNANTMIINRADKLGLAQLHQLRGRVGRSHHRAYAYLITPSRKVMTKDAVQRLDALASLEDVGAGFMLANHDLEIRGAGELLGEEQSGQVEEVGFTLYMELLDRAVQSLKSGKIPDRGRLSEPLEVDIQSPAFIPDDYLPDVHTRLMLYKRIANAQNREALRGLYVEIIDRFGLLPEPTKTLFRVTELKLHALPMGITKLIAGPKGGRIVFGAQPNVDTAKLVQLIQQQRTVYTLEGKDKLRFTVPLPDVGARVQCVERILHAIAPTT